MAMKRSRLLNMDTEMDEMQRAEKGQSAATRMAGMR